MTTRSILGALGVRCMQVGALAWMVGCGSRGGAGTQGEVGTYDRDASGSFLGDDASTSGPLDASIEENHVAVKIVTLSCAGGCADVVAVATGGHPPYAFAWDDGSTTASRHVCPSSSTHYDVNVTDTGVTGELAQPAQTVQVPLTANVRQTYCATFTPTQETPYLGLGPVALPDAGEFAELLVDHIVPVAACP